MFISLHLNAPVTVHTLNVPRNGGRCVELQTVDGLSLFLEGHGAAAAVSARALASALLATADSIDADIQAAVIATALAVPDTAVSL